MIVLLVVALKMILAEARVYCEDIHATPWKPLGLPCPITCRALHSTAQKLKQTDYENLIEAQIYNINMTHNTTNKSRIKLRSNSDDMEDNMLYIGTFNACENLFRSDTFNKDFRDELTKLMDIFNMTCYLKSDANRFFRLVLNNCTDSKATNGSKEYVLNHFKDFLNKYAHYDYPFNKEMALIILKHLLKNTKNRNSNIETILSDIKGHLIPDELQIPIAQKVIYLESKNCLSVYMSGCFCKKGYVEEFGQCLTPAECLRNLNYSEYLPRIILT